VVNVFKLFAWLILLNLSNRQRLNDPNWAHFGLMFPRKFLQRLDEAKGPYYSRNKYILKILEEHLNENENENEIGEPGKNV
jgi:hypothetical protein